MSLPVCNRAGRCFNILIYHDISNVYYRIKGRKLNDDISKLLSCSMTTIIPCVYRFKKIEKPLTASSQLGYMSSKTITRKISNLSATYKTNCISSLVYLFSIFFLLIDINFFSGNITAAVNWNCMSLLLIIFLTFYMQSVSPQFQYCNFLLLTFYTFQKSDNILC